MKTNGMEVQLCSISLLAEAFKVKGEGERKLS